MVMEESFSVNATRSFKLKFFHMGAKISWMTTPNVFCLSSAIQQCEFDGVGLVRIDED